MKKNNDYDAPHCLTCGTNRVDNRMTHFIVTPGFIITPAEYNLCDEHKDVRYDWCDIYEENGKRKEIDHEGVIARSRKDD